MIKFVTSIVRPVTKSASKTPGSTAPSPDHAPAPCGGAACASYPLRVLLVVS
jgi:hypothetical protein